MDFSALLTFPDAQAISKLTVIPCRGYSAIADKRLTRYILQNCFGNTTEILYKYLAISLRIFIPPRIGASVYVCARTKARALGIHHHVSAALYLRRTVCPRSFGTDVGRRTVRVSLLYGFIWTIHWTIDARSKSLFTVSLSVGG